MDRIQKYIGLTAVFLLLCGLVFPADKARADTRIFLSKGQSVYVPIYSHIYSGNREHPFYLAATLSIRNTDAVNPVTITTANYYDSDGNLLMNYLEKPIKLKALASTRFVVKESHKAGGSGANFIVKWEADKKVIPPLIESVMIGTQSQQGLSFTSRGIVVEENQ
ncbi:MAG: DUF3124 domain-containing protein [Desulfobacteraceae bacterium]|nr:DUF3124 domain-containing protein [Desulfobacteraceae bacterium]MBC2757501.1 DUF3124 domain-containing protein [Desulfobacteraceae bacterium]